MLITAVLLMGVLRVSTASSPSPPEGLTAVSQPTPMPAFELVDVRGSTVRSADVQGKVVVVRFWATW